jgi:hypothetical protein
MSAFVVPSDLLDLVPEDFFPLDCDIQQPTPTTNADGSVTTGYSNVTGLTGLKCRKSAIVQQRPQPMEGRGPYYTEFSSDFKVIMRGYFPAILKSYKALIDGDLYNITGIEHDANHIMTRLRVELVTT